MSCDISNALIYKKGDNEPTKITLQNKDGSRITDIQTNTDEITFQALDDDENIIIELLLTTGKIQLTTEINSSGATVDVAILKPSTSDTDVDLGTYNIFLRLNLNTPTRQNHPDLINDGQPLTKMVIEQGTV